MDSDESDRELLELAAKAAGITLLWPQSWTTSMCLFDVTDAKHHKLWNPLTDDGDALRLAVKLDMHVLRFENMTSAKPLSAEWGCDERDGGDPLAATRRAIVRAAAEIGKSQQAT